MSDLTDELYNQIDWYLNVAGQSRNENVALFRRQIDQYRELLVMPGLHQICIRLRQKAMDTISPSYIKSGSAGNYADKMIIGFGLMWIATYADVILELARMGEEKVGGESINTCRTALVDALQGYDEDINALAAVMLALPPFIQPLTMKPLKARYKSANGTGLKIAIAYALLAHSDIELFDKFAPHYLSKPDELEALFEVYRKNHRLENLLKPKKTKQVCYQGISKEAVKLVCFDIATDGLGPRSYFRDWVRVAS